MELGQVINVAVNSDPEGIGLVVRRNVALRKRLGHCILCALSRGYEDERAGYGWVIEMEKKKRKGKRRWKQVV